MTNPNYPVEDTEKNKQLLQSSRPKSARLIKEDFTIINYTDAIVESGGEVKIRAIATK
jgi:hypothetical protein